MGDPRPGQFPDNIFISIQQLKLTGVKIGNVGDILYRPAADNLWASVNVDNPTIDAALIAKGIAQTRVDFDTTGLAGGKVSIEAFRLPSYIYAVAGGVINPGDSVTIDTNGKFVATTTQNLMVGVYSRLSTDSAGNNSAVLDDIIIVKLGVN